MQIEAIAVEAITDSYNSGGKCKVAFNAVLPSGETGTLIHIYEFEKRDMLDERLYASGNIADDVRAFLGEDSPYVFDCFNIALDKHDQTDPRNWNVLELEADTPIFDMNKAV